MKPDWKDAPIWAKWLAQDESGKWNWFDKMPLLSISNLDYDPYKYFWCPDEELSEFKYECAGYDKPNPDWQSTLEKRPPLDKKQG